MEYLEGAASGLLFRFFLAGTPCTGKPFAADRDTDFEALAVIRPLFIECLVFGRDRQSALRVLL